MSLLPSAAVLAASPPPPVPAAGLSPAFLAALGAAPRSLFLHDGHLARLRPSHHGLLDGVWLAVRSSAPAIRAPRPFWGLRQRILSLFLATPAWAIALLDGPASGWLLSPADVAALLAASRWPLSRQEYKITPPLPPTARFDDLPAARLRLEQARGMAWGETGGQPPDPPR